ncbi:hypothetical protein [Nonomuraea dietziae]|uniref:hypothetical protein n=1 Tax=Nonomuraea dietziae TaxID=65515 RepID=UPI0031E31607
MTLCAEREADPYVTVHGDGGRIRLWYTRDEVRVGEDPVVSYGRDDLLENLVSGGGAASCRSPAPAPSPR